MTKREALLAVAAALYFVSTTVSASADPAKNIVLVHGAWVDGSGWKPVYEILRKEGFNVTMVQEPETSFADDVTAAKRILDLQDGPTVLVGHSYGGSIITEAGMHPNVVGLVYLDPADFPKLFAPDLPHEQAEFEAKSQVLAAASVFNTPLTAAAWKTKP